MNASYPNGPGDWLSLAAAPTFALMALLSGIAGGSALCSSGPEAWPLVGMAPMYWLMSVFHSASWLRLILRLSTRGR